MLKLTAKSEQHVLELGRLELVLTIRKGAIIQLTNMLNAICLQISRWLNTRCRVSNRTLHIIGYIITSNPTATTISTLRP